MPDSPPKLRFAPIAQKRHRRKSRRAIQPFIPLFVLIFFLSSVAPTTSANEIKRFGKELDEYRSDLFKKEYLPRVQPFPRVRQLFQRIRADNKSIALATSGKGSETKH